MPLAFGELPIEWPAPWVGWDARRVLLTAKCIQVLRDAENAYRDGEGIPRVGEGWVSEMALLRELQVAFPHERITHQARPGWLAPQSLDIFFPERMIGVEYQGVQHTRPVEFFGGVDTFKTQLERDERKRDACDAFGCHLIEVHPGYVLADVVAKISELIAARE